MALKFKAEAEILHLPAEVVSGFKVLVESHPMSAIEALTQEYLILYRKYEEHEVKPLITRMEAIKKELQTYANDQMDPKKPAVFSCAEGELEFSERGKTTEIMAPALLVNHLVEQFGIDVAFSVVNIALTPLRKILTDYELKKFSKDVPGARTLKSVRPVKEPV